jgi:hypothetical protein
VAVPVAAIGLLLVVALGRLDKVLLAAVALEMLALAAAAQVRSVAQMELDLVGMVFLHQLLAQQ